MDVGQLNPGHVVVAVKPHVETALEEHRNEKSR
jgi:diadenosine tetraphosphate (Ap4A) HIT family hydrolase